VYLKVEQLIKLYETNS